MIMADLKTNYVDDVLDTTKNQVRKYKQIQNDDGTVSFVDVTEYTQVGTSFGAKDINDTNAAINAVNGKLKLNFGIETKAITVTTDSNGSAYIEGKYILAVTSDTNDVKITLFNNIYGMWYAKILQSSTDQPYTGNFTLYVLKLKE